MNGHVDLWLPDFALQSLPVDEQAMVEGHLQGCARCRREAAALTESLSLLPLALPAVPPPPALRQRLLKIVKDEADSPFAAFVDRIAALFQIQGERAAALLRTLYDPTAWGKGPTAAIGLIHVHGGPALAGADAGFVRLPAGVTFPHHRHVGDEHGIVLQGGLRDSDGSVYRAGDEQRHPAGSDHEFSALPDGDCIFAAVVHGGVIFDDGYSLS